MRNISSLKSLRYFALATTLMCSSCDNKEELNKNDKLPTDKYDSITSILQKSRSSIGISGNSLKIGLNNYKSPSVMRFLNHDEMGDYSLCPKLIRPVIDPQITKKIELCYGFRDIEHYCGQKIEVVSTLIAASNNVQELDEIINFRCRFDKDCINNYKSDAKYFLEKKIKLPSENEMDEVSGDLEELEDYCNSTELDSNNEFDSIKIRVLRFVNILGCGTY